MSAGKSVGITALGEVKGSLSAGDSVFVSSFGKASPASVTATNGSVVIISAQEVTSLNITSGDSVAIISGGSSQVVASATQDVFVMSMGWQNTLAVTAGQNVFVWSAGSLAGDFEGTAGDVVAISLSTFGGAVTAGNDAFVLSFDMMLAIVDAGGSAIGVGMSMTAGMFEADEDAFVFSLGAAQPLAIEAGGHAGLITLAGSNATVEGIDSAFVWSAGDFNGTVTSTAGSAGLVAIGQGIGTSVTAATDAVVMTGGLFFGNVTAGDSAFIITLLDNDGTVTAGEDIFLISEADINGSATAGGSAYAIAVGDIDASLIAGADAGAFAFGSFGGSINAGGNVTGVYSVGDLTGTIQADGDVGTGIQTGSLYDSIFSHGSILANILAGTSSGGSETGHVGSIGAWGPISGSVNATKSIGSLRSAGAITASLNAPTIGTVSENDPNLIASTPLPEIPDSVRADLLADVAAAVAEIQTQRATAATDIATMKSDFATARTDTANAIEDLKSEVSSAAADAMTGASAGLSDQKIAVTQDLTNSATEFEQALLQLRAEAAAFRAQLVKEDSDAVAAADAAVAAISKEFQDIQDKLVAQDIAFNDHRTAIVAGKQQVLDERQGAWDEYKAVARQQMADILAAYNYRKALADQLAALGENSRMAYDVMVELKLDAEGMLRDKLERLETAQQSLLALVNAVAPIISDGWILATGTDILDKKVGGGAYAGALLGVAGALVASRLPGGFVDDLHDGFGPAAKVNRTGGRTARFSDASASLTAKAKRKGKTAAKSVDGCFYPGQLVHQFARDSQETALAEATGAPTSHNHAGVWWALAALGGIATFAILYEERRRTRNRRIPLSETDAFFASSASQWQLT